MEHFYQGYHDGIRIPQRTNFNFILYFIKLMLLVFSTSLLSHAFGGTALDELGRRLDTPALRQFSQQANCAVREATYHMGVDVLKQSILLAAAESCVPQNFIPETGGLPEGLIPPTREERVISITIAAGRRIKLCEQLGILGLDRSTKCAQHFERYEF